jgi:hypothetical protein
MMLNLESGEVASLEFSSIERDDAIGEVGLEHYGVPPELNLTDPTEHVHQRLELSKQLLKADGFAGPVLLLFGEGRGRIFPISFDDDEPREIKMAALVESVSAWQFDGAVYASETWLGRPGSKGQLLGVPASRLLPSNREFFNDDSLGQRDEGLIVVGMSASGKGRVLTQPFGRVVGGYIFGKVMIDESGREVPDFLRPIWERWN